MAWQENLVDYLVGRALFWQDLSKGINHQRQDLSPPHRVHINSDAIWRFVLIVPRPSRVFTPPRARAPSASRGTSIHMEIGGMATRSAATARIVVLLAAAFACGFLAGRGDDVQQNPADSARRLAQVSQQYAICRLEATSMGPLEALLGLDKASASDAVSTLAKGLPIAADAFTPLQRRPGSKSVMQDAFVRFQNILFQHSPPLLPLHERGARGPRDRNFSHSGTAAAGARPSSARPPASARRRRAAKPKASAGADYSASEVGGATWSTQGAKGTPSLGGPARKEISW